MVANERRDAPLVSAILPTYDRPEMLAEAVESVAAQDYSPIELVVVDDASSTPAEDVVAAHAPDDLRWRCLRHERNRGANAARNTGLRESNGEVVAFLDDDDRWAAGKVSAQVSAFEAASEAVGVVLVGQRVVAEDGETTSVRLPELEGDATPGLVSDVVGGPFSTIAVRRSAVEAAGPPDERFPAWQDREWLVRLSRHCEFVSLREPLVIKRLGDYEQIGDEFELKRDVTYPLFLQKHRDLAADYDSERHFVASLAAGVAAAALSNGYYADARRFAAKAIRTDPRHRVAYLYLLLALGGGRTYASAARLKRSFGRLSRGGADGTV